MAATIEAARRIFRRRARMLGVLLTVAAVLLILLGLLALVVDVFG